MDSIKRGLREVAPHLPRLDEAVILNHLSLTRSFFDHEKQIRTILSWRSAGFREGRRGRDSSAHRVVERAVPSKSG